MTSNNTRPNLDDLIASAVVIGPACHALSALPGDKYFISNSLGDQGRRLESIRAMKERRLRVEDFRSTPEQLGLSAHRSTRRPARPIQPVPAIRAVHRQREHRASTTSPRAASSSGATRSGPSAEAGPPSAGGDDPDGPPPDLTSRANAPNINLDGDLVHAHGVDVAVAIAVAATVAVANVHPALADGQPGVLNSEKPRTTKEESMSRKVTNYLAVALIVAVFTLIFPVTVRAHE